MFIIRDGGAGLSSEVRQASFKEILFLLLLRPVECDWEARSGEKGISGRVANWCNVFQIKSPEKRWQDFSKL